MGFFSNIQASPRDILGKKVTNADEQKMVRFSDRMVTSVRIDTGRINGYWVLEEYEGYPSYRDGYWGNARCLNGISVPISAIFWYMQYMNISIDDISRVWAGMQYQSTWHPDSADLRWWIGGKQVVILLVFSDMNTMMIEVDHMMRLYKDHLRNLRKEKRRYGIL